MNCIDYMNKISFGISIAFCVLCSCTSRTGQKSSDETLQVDRWTGYNCGNCGRTCRQKITPEEIQITKELLYDKYTLEDTYPYKDTTRSFQWEKIKEQLALLENIQIQPSQWAILQNYKNRNGEAPLVKNFKKKCLRTGSGHAWGRTIPVCPALSADGYGNTRTLRAGW